MSADQRLSILACQISIPAIRSTEERDAHVRSVCDAIAARLERRRADLVVLPELSTLDYSRDSFSALAALAEADDGASHQAFARLALRYQCAVVFGYARQHAAAQQGSASTQAYTIAQQAVMPRRSAAGQASQAVDTVLYEKLALAQFGDSSEKDFFQPGSRLGSFSINGIRVGILVCYDIRFPELCQRLVSEQQCSLILHCGAYARDPSFASREAFVVTRAMENQVPVLALNRAGSHYGESLWVPPWVDAEHPVLRLDRSAEEFRYLHWSATQTDTARQQYPIRADWQAIERRLEKSAPLA